MKQIIQDMKSGATILEEVPAPLVKRGCLLIKTHRSLVSLGTEKMLVEFGKASLLEKVRQQPERVKQVMDKVKSDGLKPTLESVFRKLGEPLQLGYCNAGEVIGIGAGVEGFKIGDRVISNGSHAEIVLVPKNLVAKIPENVSYEEASFTVIGSIGLQGIRLAAPTFGETVVVIGLGLIGLLTAQLLKANGCKVIGTDFDERKIQLGKSLGIDCYNVSNADPVQIVYSLTEGVGADAVIITASAKTDEVIAQSAQMSRKRGRIVLVGVIGLDINRADFYTKELSFQVSCSYGPGRYDDNYETKGIDYPLSFVRWTEQRNFEAVLNAISSGLISVKELISERVKLSDYQLIYSNLGGSGSIASIIEYASDNKSLLPTVNITANNFTGNNGVLGIIGAGNFTGATMLPILGKLKANIKYIASSKGLSGTTLAKKYRISKSTTDYQELLHDAEVSAVLITTRHHAHAKQTVEVLESGKHVFVEKPLALNLVELEEIANVYQRSTGTITVGFNRRFSPFSVEAKKMLGNADMPMNIIATMNAGFIPADSWVHDPESGGGRIIGEACHYIDLISFFTGSEVAEVVMNAMGISPEISTDNASILLKYKNGSTGVINYFSNGSKAYSKERVEIYAQNKTIIIDNFKKSHYYGFRNAGMSRSQDKGHFDQFRQYLERLKSNGESLIPFSSLYNTSKTAIMAIESLKTHSWQNV